MAKEEIKKLLQAAIKILQEKKVFPRFPAPDIRIERPEEKIHGDYAANVAMIIAKKIKKSPMEAAEMLSSKLRSQSSKLFEKIEAAEPGFINFFLSKEYLQKQVEEILKRKEKFGQLKIGKSKKIQVEFISANPTGPLTLANGRGGFLGDVLSNVLEHAGNKVEREYYVNDTGNQIIALGKSLLAATGFIPAEENLYKGAYVKEWADKNISIVKEHKDNALKLGQIAAKDFLKEIKSTLEATGIKFNRWTSEDRHIHKKSFVEKALKIFKSKDLTYQKDNALWLKTTKFGDDKDRVLITSDGFPTYFLADSGHYLETKSRGFNKKINIFGPDHHGYTKRIQIAAKILGYSVLEILTHGKIRDMEKDVESGFGVESPPGLFLSGLTGTTVVITQPVRMISGGEEIKISKRKGKFITFEDLINEVRTDTARFFFLMVSPDTHLNFDMELAKERSEKNPVFYVQYAHARICSIFQKLRAQNSKLKAATQNLKLLNHASELELIKQLIRLPEIIEDTAKDYQVQRLPQYAIDLATSFHQFYRDCRVILEDKSLSEARLALVLATKIVLKNTLSLMGISAPEMM